MKKIPEELLRRFREVNYSNFQFISCHSAWRVCNRFKGWRRTFAL